MPVKDMEGRLVGSKNNKSSPSSIVDELDDIIPVKETLTTTRAAICPSSSAVAIFWVANLF